MEYLDGNACNLNLLLDLINQFIDIGKHRGHRVVNLLSKIALRGESHAVWLDDRAHDDQSIRQKGIHPEFVELLKRNGKDRNYDKKVVDVEKIQSYVNIKIDCCITLTVHCFFADCSLFLKFCRVFGIFLQSKLYKVRQKDFPTLDSLIIL